MSKQPETVVEERSFSGLAVQKANIRMHKLSHTMKEVRVFVTDNPEITNEDLTKAILIGKI